MTKPQVVVSIDAIRSVLLRVWDPLNVGENNKLRDEYDRYIPAVTKALSMEVSRDTLIALLADLEFRLGVEGAARKRTAAATQLLRIPQKPHAAT